MGGTKHAIEIAEIKKQTVKSVAFTKRRNGLFRKASALCRRSPSTRIAILATPPSTNSHASFYSFGHSSVENVVSTLLGEEDHQTPVQPLNQDDNNNPGSGFWWEDNSFDRSENEEDLKNAADALARMISNIRIRLDEKRRVEIENQVKECLTIKHVEEEKKEEELEIPQIVNDDDDEEKTDHQLVHSTEDLLGDGEGDFPRIDDDFFTGLAIDPLF